MMNVVNSRVMIEGKPHVMMSVVYPEGECNGKELMNLMLETIATMMEGDGESDMANCIREMDEEQRKMLVKASVQMLYSEDGIDDMEV